MKQTVRRFGCAAIAALFACSPLAVRAQEKPANYPLRPVRIIVGIAPGGGLDSTTRLVAHYTSSFLHLSSRIFGSSRTDRRYPASASTSVLGSPNSTNGHGPPPWGMKATGMRSRRAVTGFTGRRRTRRS